MRQVVAGVELVAPRALGAFDGAVELGPFGRQHEQHEALVFAGLFELGHELGAAVDLDSFDRKREGGEQLVEEVFGAAGGGG